MATLRKKSLRKTINLKQLLKCVGFVVLAFYLSVTLVDQQRRINDNTQRTQEVQAQIANANLQTEMLREELARVDTYEYLERVARETLRLAMPGDRIFIDSARIR